MRSVVAESVQYCLRVIVGKSYGEEFLLSPGEERVIGSEDAADIRLPDEGVEPRHARVQLERDELRVVDIGGAKSMKVNGSKQRSARLENGDQLALGAVTLRVQRRARLVGERNADGQGQANGNGHGHGSGKKKKRGAEAKEAEATARAAASDPLSSAGAYGERSGEDGDASASLQRGSAAAALTTRERPAGHVEVLDREDDLQHEDATAAMALEENGLWWPKDELPPLELQHVWFDLARNDRWRSLAVVPTDPATPTLPVAHAFARMASLNPQSHVLLVDATPRGPLLGQKRPLAGTIASQVKQFPQANYDFLDASSLGLNDAEVAHLYIPQLLEYIASGTGRYNKVLIAVGSLLQHARSIPVARAVDAVLLNVGVGTSRLPDVNRTVEIVGRDRVMGSLTVEGID